MWTVACKDFPVKDQVKVPLPSALADITFATAPESFQGPTGTQDLWPGAWLTFWGGLVFSVHLDYNFPESPSAELEPQEALD